MKSDQPCGKRLHPMLPTWLQAYSKRQEIDEASKRRILSVSPATLDRVLRDCKVDEIHKANKQTISALKQSIPIIDTTRKIDVAGHLYADTVAHCGDSIRGNFVWTLTVTDDLTLWTLNRAIWNKGQDATCTAFLYLLREMPFMVRSINTDNGSEFINYHLQRMLKERYKRCKLTRSRPYKKNDNARAE
ncbi:MAG: transposase family protein, partial [Bacteroidaceae bacterium]|nr:transposase family protein [Bacteroidaceae bacterium]